MALIKGNFSNEEFQRLLLALGAKDPEKRKVVIGNKQYDFYDSSIVFSAFTIDGKPISPNDMNALANAINQNEQVTDIIFNNLELNGGKAEDIVKVSRESMVVLVQNILKNKNLLSVRVPDPLDEEEDPSTEKLSARIKELKIEKQNTDRRLDRLNITQGDQVATYNKQKDPSFKPLNSMTSNELMERHREAIDAANQSTNAINRMNSFGFRFINTFLSIFRTAEANQKINKDIENQKKLHQDNIEFNKNKAGYIGLLYIQKSTVEALEHLREQSYDFGKQKIEAHIKQNRHSLVEKKAEMMSREQQQTAPQSIAHMAPEAKRERAQAPKILYQKAPFVPAVPVAPTVPGAPAIPKTTEINKTSTSINTKPIEKPKKASDKSSSETLKNLRDDMVLDRYQADLRELNAEKRDVKSLQAELETARQVATNLDNAFHAEQSVLKKERASLLDAKSKLEFDEIDTNKKISNIDKRIALKSNIPTVYNVLNKSTRTKRADRERELRELQNERARLKTKEAYNKKQKPNLSTQLDRSISKLEDIEEDYDEKANILKAKIRKLENVIQFKQKEEDNDAKTFSERAKTATSLMEGEEPKKSFEESLKGVGVDLNKRPKSFLPLDEMNKEQYKNGNDLKAKDKNSNTEVDPKAEHESEPEPDSFDLFESEDSEKPIPTKPIKRR